MRGPAQSHLTLGKLLGGALFAAFVVGWFYIAELVGLEDGAAALRILAEPLAQAVRR